MENMLISRSGHPCHDRARGCSYLSLSPRFWIGLLGLLILISTITYQFSQGYLYESNETTNIYLKLARGGSYAMLVLLAVLWLPVMGHTITWLREHRIGVWLPLNRNRKLHHWLGHGLLVLAVLHGCQYVFYYTTLQSPLPNTLLGRESDIVRAMRTTMYEFVSEDESIELVANWIAQGAPFNRYKEEIQPLLKEDCTKCHSNSSSQTWAVPELPLNDYREALEWTSSGVNSKQFRINFSGLLLLTITLLIWFIALAPVRRRIYHQFQQVHRLSYPLVVILTIHLINSLLWLLVPMIFLMVEIYLSRQRNLYLNCEAKQTEAASDIIRLEIKRPKSFDIRAGHYVQIRIPCLSRYEWHPFSLTGPREHDDQLVLKIRCRGDWTRKLAEQKQLPIQVDLRGPYASPATLAKHSANHLLLAGGIGITPFLGLLHNLTQKTGTTGEIHLMWVFKEIKLLQWLQPLVSLIDRQSGFHCHWHLYLTTDSAANSVPEWINNPPSNLHISLQRGRPNLPSLISQIIQHSSTPDCYICGPDSFTKQAATACRDRQLRVTQEHF